MDINVVTSLVGAITGLVGGVAGCVALFQTHAGNKLAKDANDSAEEANEIDAINSRNGFFFAGIGTCRVTVHVTYTTELGSRRNTEIEQGLTNGQRH